MGLASVEGAYDSEFSGSVQFCFGVPRACGRRPEASTHGVDLLMQLEEQAPLLRGCPDRRGERQAKGRGPKVAQQRLGRSARSALRVPRQITGKGRPWGQPFSVIWRREGDCRVHPCTRSRCALRLGTRLRRSGSAPAEPSNPGVASHHPSHPPDKRKRATLWAALLRLSGGERGKQYLDRPA